MKKFLIVTISLFYSVIAHAGIISVPTFSADSSVAHLETFRTTVQNAINGQIQGSATTGSSTNILADSVGELDMGNEVNPRVRDSEILGITVDSTTASNAYVASGLLPATDASLTSNISAGTTYINGYRVVKTATAHTYTASKDTYVDVSQTGTFTYSEVSVGAAAPSVAANSARLAKVTTSGTAITTVTDLANRRVTGLIVPTNYRSGMFISRDSATTMTVEPGSIEINNTMVSKTSTTTLTLTVAGDWAGGASLQAASAYGYVGCDASGNLKLHTTAPTHQNYGVSLTSGKKRYATWSSTVYRIIGWFYMNSTGSGQLNTYEVGNLKEGDVGNYSFLSSSTSVNNATILFVADTEATTHFYSSGGPVEMSYRAGLGNSGANNGEATISMDNAGLDDVRRQLYILGASTDNRGIIVNWTKTASQAGHTISGMYKSDGGTTYVVRRSLKVEEK